MSYTGNDNQKNLLFHTISQQQQGEEGEDGAGGAGGGSAHNVAISDGLMFKIKIATPEEIKAKHVGTAHVPIALVAKPGRRASRAGGQRE